MKGDPLSTGRFHLGWFLGNNFSVYGWNQPWAGTTAEDWSDVLIGVAVRQVGRGP